jgi:DNA replication protein DnaC
MTREQTFDQLYSLKLHGFADALEEQLKNPEMDGLGFEERLALLVDAQYLWRENRAYAARLRQAHLKTAASIEDINYRHPRNLDRSLVQSLAGCEWIRRRHNLTIIGPSGVGKTYLCCAFLEKACREGFRAYYASASKFFRRLGMAWADGSFDRLLAKLARTDVLAIYRAGHPFRQRRRVKEGGDRVEMRRRAEFVGRRSRDRSVSVRGILLALRPSLRSWRAWR